MTPLSQAFKPRTTAAKLLASALAAVVIGLLGGASTWSAFNDLSANGGNSFTAGTVTIGDDDGGTAMFSALTGVKPGDSFTRCIVVTYDGSLPARVRMHGTTGGSGLDQYLSLTVTRGSKSSAFSSCGDFVADSTTYISGKPAGVVYDGTLAGYPDSTGNAIADPTSSSPETWTSGESHAYRVELTLQDDLAAEGKSATQSLRWEAENE